MKKLFSFFTISAMLMLVLASCSKSDNPVNNQVFIGTYTGKISYKKPGTDISKDNGEVTVTKFGDRYDFQFHNSGIPAVKDIIIADGKSVSLDLSGTYKGLITISESKLTIGVTKDGATWTADCNR